MPKARINGNVVTFTDEMEIGQGNEAYVYKWGKKAVKHYKLPTDPSYSGAPDEENERKMAAQRLVVVQTKLPEYPKGLPAKMVTPEDIGYEVSGNKISCYVMPYLENAVLLKEYTSANFRLNANVHTSRIARMFRRFRKTVLDVHAKDVVLADFTILNNMVVEKTDDIYIVDADAAQFGKYLTTTFTARYVDPRLCDPNETKPVLIHRHDMLSDWYAFAVMLFECLTMTHPVYGGTYKPKGPNDRVKDEQRGLKNITVFHPQVRYPKQGVPLDTFPKEVVQCFYEIFVEGRRNEFPDQILSTLETGKSVVSHIPVNQQLVVVRGNVTATQEFLTRGVIVYATVQSGTLRLVYYEDGQFKREDKSLIMEGIPEKYQRFRVKGDITYHGQGNIMTRYQSTVNPRPELVETYLGTVSQLDSNSKHVYWIKSGELYHDSPYGEEFIANVFQGGTQFWVGPSFGFGFYRAGGITVGFVFDAEDKGMNDQVQIPQISGQLTDSTCVFSHEYAWFFYTAKEGADIKNFAVVVNKSGNIVGRGHAIERDGSWLSSIRGKCPVGSVLFAPTDNGVVKVEVVDEELVQTQVFPDTEPFVSETTFLLPGPGGLYAVSNKSVYLLKIK